jgi:hypothetical protein
MAQAPKIPVISNPTQVSPTRAIPGAPFVASDSYPEVQPTSAGTNVMLGGAEFAYDRSRRDLAFAYDGRREQRSVPQSWSLIQTPSETFARILENIVGGAEGASGAVRGSAKRFQDVIARAIATYEANAKVIHGETALVGGAISIRL